MAAWTTEYINKLPDSAFLYIEDGGEKDSDGKTTPRSLRHLPYKDANGNIDMPHVRDALARLDQVQNMPADVKEKIRAKCQKILESAKTKADRLTENGVVRIAPVTLDANGELPTRVQLFITGDWPNSIKGNFAISLDDLKEIKAHFDEKVGFPTEDASTGLAIDFEHDYAGPAAAWIKGLELDADETNGTGALYADPVEWTAAGADAIKGGVYKCISPMGAFGRHDDQPSMWQSVTDLTHALANVLEGAGLTNIPFLQGMSPIRASATPDAVDLEAAGMVFVGDNTQEQDKENKEITHMTLDELRVKDKDQLTAEEVAFATEHKDELNADERVRLGLEAPKAEATDALSAEDKDLLAAIKSGDKVVVDKTTLSKLDKIDSLEKTAEEFRKSEAEKIVLSHVQRGAIKPTEAPTWVGTLLSADEKTRETLEASLKALPDNELLAKEIGHKEEIEVDVNDELKQKTTAFLSAAEARGEKLTYGQAQVRLLAEDKDLNDRVELARQTK